MDGATISLVPCTCCGKPQFNGGLAILYFLRLDKYLAFVADLSFVEVLLGKLLSSSLSVDVTSKELKVERDCLNL